MKKHYIPGIGIVGSTAQHPVEEQIDMLARIGWGATFTGWKPECTTAWANAAERAGLIYQSIHAPFLGARLLWESEDKGREEAQRLVDCVKDCAAHHIPVMVIHPFIGFDAHTPEGSFYLYVQIPKGVKGGQTFANAEEFSQWMITEKLISTVPWDDVGHFVRFSATFVAPTIEDEAKVLDEVKKRLADSVFIF